MRSFYFYCSYIVLRRQKFGVFSGYFFYYIEKIWLQNEVNLGRSRDDIGSGEGGRFGKR